MSQPRGSNNSSLNHNNSATSATTNKNNCKSRAVSNSGIPATEQQNSGRQKRGNSSDYSTILQGGSGVSTLGESGKSGGQQVVNSASSGASTTQRLSSIEILNENRQRQIQFKQQESFKLHLEQRQKQLIEQQELQSSRLDSGSSCGGSHLSDDYTYRVNTSAPEYMASAAANAATAATAKKPPARSTSGGLALNPFDGQPEAGRKRPPSAPANSGAGDKATSVSGKNGFLSALLDEASFEELRADGNKNELDSSSSGKSINKLSETTRYAQVAASSTRSYNYDDDPEGKPFYQKDFTTLLNECRASRKLVILIVAIALLLDNMLLTSVVPIIPAYLYKLRIERQHRELIAVNGSSEPSSSSMKGLYKTQTLPNGSRLDGDELEAEIERRINQSLANAKDRYSGSVFHPRVRLAQMRQQQSGLAEDDDEDDDADGSNQNGETDQMVNRNTDRQPMKQVKARVKDDNEDDYYEDTEQQGKSLIVDTKTKANPSLKSQIRESSSRRPSMTPPTTAMGSLKLSSRNNDNDEDNDDEDIANSRKWERVRNSLVSMAKTSGLNDTENLGGMCLNMVLGRKMDDESEENDGANQPSLMSENNRNLGRTSSKENDSNDDEDDDRKQATKMRGDSRRQGGQRKQDKRSARVERLMPRVIKPQKSRVETTSQSSTTTTTTTSEPTTLADDDIVISHQDIVDESFEVGVMFASKPIVQAFANPFIGTLTNKVGFTIPMFTGFVIMFLSTLVFAFGSTYSTLFIARAIQGVGSACTSVAGMSMLADRFPDDAERGNAMAIALGGLALGVVIGPPFGGFMYEFVGKSSPFIVLSILALLDGLLQLLVLQPRVTENQEEGASLMTLIKDPYILVAAGAITFANTGIAILEPALPLWMMDTMQAKNWEQGVAFLPAALSYMLGTNLFGNLGHKIGRWRSTMIGLIIIGCSLLLIPFATRVDHLILPNGAIGFAMGMVDSTMMPMLGYLVDIRHTSVYGSVYAIGDVAFCASFAFGPALSGTLVELIGFEGLVITTAFICFGFAPLLLLLKDPPARQLDEAQLQEQSTLRYVNYSHLDSPDEEAQLTDYRSNAKTYVR